MIIYKSLGADAETQFANQWGVGYAMDNASEWQEVCKTAVKTALILVILDLLRITKDRPWFEEHTDFVSVQVRTTTRVAACCARVNALRLTRRPPSAQAMLFNGAARNWWTQTKVLVRYQTRLTDK